MCVCSVCLVVSRISHNFLTHTEPLCFLWYIIWGLFVVAMLSWFLVRVFPLESVRHSPISQARLSSKCPRESGTSWCFQHTVHPNLKLQGFRVSYVGSYAKEVLWLFNTSWLALWGVLYIDKCLQTKFLEVDNDPKFPIFGSYGNRQRNSTMKRQI